MTRKKTLGRALLAILALNGILPLLESVLGGDRPWAGLSFFWPFYYAFENNFKLQPGQFWKSLFFSHVLGWTFLAWSSLRLPHSWQAEPLAENIPKSRMAGTLFSIASPRLPASLRAADPVMWLALRGTTGRFYIWLVVGSILAIRIFFELTKGPYGWASGQTYGLPLQFLLKILVAAQAGRFFIEARRSGAFELLLCTPVPSATWIEAQWRALRRTFALPFLILAGASLGLVLMPFAPLQPFASFFTGAGMASFGSVFSTAYGLLKFFTDVYAVAWVAMWLALSVKNPNFAVAWASLFVLVLPTFAPCVPDPLIDLLFMNWARKNLRADLRATIQKQMATIHSQAARASQPLRVPPVLHT